MYFKIFGFFFFAEQDQYSLEVFKKSQHFGKAHFTNDYLSEIELCINEKGSSRHDFNWIELILNEDGTLNDDWEEYAQKYWAGVPVPNKEPIWETIALGYITILSEKIIQEALLNISCMWPHSFFIFAYSILSSTHPVENSQGIVTPIIIGENNKCKLSFVMSQHDIHDSSFLSETDRSIVDKYLYDYKHTFNMEVSETFQVPDLRGFEVEIPLHMVKNKHDLPYTHNIKLSYPKDVWKKFIQNNLGS